MEKSLIRVNFTRLPGTIDHRNVTQSLLSCLGGECEHCYHLFTAIFTWLSMSELQNYLLNLELFCYSCHDQSPTAKVLRLGKHFVKKKLYPVFLCEFSFVMLAECPNKY